MGTKFVAKKCEHCHQTENYKLGLDKGSAKIVLAVLEKISEKGVNEIHPANELEITKKNKWFLTNLSRPRFHGLLAYVDGKEGYYCLTRKAGKFLRNEKVPRYAVISKVTRHQEGYWLPEEETITLKELMKEEIMWEGNQSRMIDLLDPAEVTPSLFNNQLSLTK